MIPQSTQAKEEFLIRWARDLSVCTEGELRKRWDEPDLRKAIDTLDKEVGGGFEARVKDHNPIYYLAENLFFDNVRGDPSFLYAPFHKERFAKPALQYYFSKPGSDAGFLLLAQRDSFKSTFQHGVTPMFATLRRYLLHGQHERLALLHQKAKQASINLMRLKEKSRSHKWFRTVWSEFASTDDFGTQEEFIWPCAGMLTGIGAKSVVSSGLTGDLTGYHFDDIFFSDLVVKEHVKSKTMREDTELRYNGFLYTVDMKAGKKWHDGTRYHIHDLWGKMLKNENMRSVVIGAGTREETLTFPTRHTMEVLEAIRQEEISRNGSDIMYWLQMQNDPRTTAMIAADLAWFRYISVQDIPIDSWRVITIDPAWKGTKNQGEGCNASIQAWAFWRVGTQVMQCLLDLTSSNDMTDLDGRKEVMRMMKKWGVVDVAPEERGGKSFGTNLRNDCVTAGLAFNLIELKTQQTGKEQRITSFLGALQAGRVHIAKECSNPKPLLDEVEDYPQVELKDNIDCAGYTADPAIADQYTPIFSTFYSERPIWARKPQKDYEQQRTRYCGD